MIKRPIYRREINRGAHVKKLCFAKPLDLILIFLVTIGINLAPVHHSFGEDLVILSPHWEGIKREYERAFNENRKTPVTFRWLDMGGTADILRFIKSQFRSTPDSIGVDLFFGGGIDPFTELEKLELLQRIDIGPELEHAIPAELRGAPIRSTQGYWFATAISSFGLVFHKKILSFLGLPPPMGWRDLTNPRYFSWIASADPRKSGSAHAIYEVVLQRFGWDVGWQILYGLAINSRSFLSSSAQGPHEIALGEVAISPLIDTYANQARRLFGDDIVGYALPEDGTIYTGDGIAVLKGAPQAALAKEFVYFVLSRAGQELIMQRRGTPGGPTEFELAKLSVRPDLYSTPPNLLAISANPFIGDDGFSYNNAVASKRWTLVNDLIGTFLIEEHERLVGIAKTLSPSQQQRFAALLAPPISEPELMELLENTSGQGAGARNARIARWREESERRVTGSMAKIASGG